MAKFTYTLNEDLKSASIFNEEGVLVGSAPIHRLNDNDWRLKVDKIITSGKKWVGIGKADSYRTEGEFDDMPSTNATGSSRFTLNKVVEYLFDDEAATFKALVEKAEARYEKDHKYDRVLKNIKVEDLDALMEMLQKRKESSM